MLDLSHDHKRICCHDLDADVIAADLALLVADWIRAETRWVNSRALTNSKACNSTAKQSWPTTLPCGLEYGGTRHQSPSSVAKAIAGSHCNG